MLQEASHVNQSLAGLGQVMSAISRGDAHVPFRDYKLTQALEPCLSGDAKCLMIVTASPSAEDREVTLQAFRFADSVAACVVARPTKGGKPVSSTKPTNKRSTSTKPAPRK